MTKVEEIFAKVMSYMFHPLLIPTYTFLIIFNHKYFFFYILPLKVKLILFANVFGFTFLFPGLIIILMHRFAFIKSYAMEMKNERSLPLLLASVFYYLTYYLFKIANFPSLMFNYFLITTVITLIALLINFFWKISLHTIAMGALMGILLSLYLKLHIDTRLWLLIAIFISGLTGTARLMISTHTEAQVYTGYLLGFVLMFSSYFLL